MHDKSLLEDQLAMCVFLCMLLQKNQNIGLWNLHFFNSTNDHHHSIAVHGRITGAYRQCN